MNKLQQKITDTFLSFGHELRAEYTGEHKLQMLTSVLDMEGNTAVKFIYFQPVSQKHHLIEHNITFDYEDFCTIAIDKTQYLKAIAFEVKMIVDEMINRPCEMTCETCKHDECTRGKIIGDTQQMLTYILGKE